MIVLNKLNTRDIDEKIQKNAEEGRDIYALREFLLDELKDFRWVIIRATVQCQCYEEQIDHINKKIKELEGENHGIR